MEQHSNSCPCDDCKRRNQKIARRIREIMGERYSVKQAVPMAFKDLGLKVSQQTIDTIIIAFEKEQEQIFRVQGLVKKADIINDREYDDMYERIKVH